METIDKVLGVLARVLPAVTGFLLLLSYPPYDRGALAWVALVPLLWCVLLIGGFPGDATARHRQVGVSLAGGFVWGAGLFHPVLGIQEGTWVQRVGGFAILCLLTSLMLGLFSAGAAGICRGIAPRRRWLAVLHFPSLWVVLEYLIRAGAAGFSTYVGVTQWQVPSMLAVASVGGVYAVSWLVVAVNTGIALLTAPVAAGVAVSAALVPARAWRGGGETVERPEQRGPEGREWKRSDPWARRRWLPLVLGAAVLVALVVGGQVGPIPGSTVGSIEGAPPLDPGAHGSVFRFVLVQPNFTPLEYLAARSGIDAQRRLWERVLGQVEEAFAQFSHEGLGGTDPEAVVPALAETVILLPETFVHYSASDDPVFRSRFSQFSTEWGINWLAGLPRVVERPSADGASAGHDDDQESGPRRPAQRNTALFIGRDGRIHTVYDKIYVIPVAEEHFEPGSELGLLELGGYTLGIGICSDVVVPDHALATVRAGATSLHYIASLAHIGELAQLERAFVVFRAAEHGVYVTQTATTGPTLVVDPRGRIIEQAVAGEPGVVVVDIEPRRRPLTPYTRFGDWVVLISGLVVMGQGASVTRLARRG